MSPKLSRRSFISMSLAAMVGVAGKGLAADDPNKLYVIHINDVHGFIAPTDTAIGYAKIAGFFESFKAAHPNTIVLHTGDDFAGSNYAAYNNAEGVLQVLNSVGLDAMAAGNADFVLGVRGLLDKASRATFPMLSANIVDANGENLLPPSTIVTTAAGTKVGVIGLTPHEVRGNRSDVPNKDIVAATQAEIDKLRPQVDVIIALAHLGDNESAEHTSLRLARETRGLDLIVDGHSHTVLPVGRVENGILIVQAGEFSKYVGLVEMDLVNGKPVGAFARLFDKDYFANGPEAAETAAVLAAVVAETDEYFGEVVGSTSVFLDGKREHVRVGETNLGNMMADAIRAAFSADVGLLSAAAIGGEFEPGVITRGDFLILMRVGGGVSSARVTGAQLLECLEDKAVLWPEMNGYFCQVSGISFELADLEGNKIHNLKVNGQPVQLDALYVVAATTNIIDGVGLSGGELLPTGIVQLEKILLDYFKHNSPVAPKLEGRISAR